MTTATNTTKQYRKFNHWMEVKKIAEEIGVPYYKKESRYRDNGTGLEKPATYARFDDGEFDYIKVVGFERVAPDNQYMADRVRKLAWENFQMKVELWALKNNIQYELITDKNYGGTTLRIVVA